MTATMADRSRSKRHVEGQRSAEVNLNRGKGRPTLLTPETQSLICIAMSVGATVREAAAAGNVSEQAVHNWKRRAIEALAKAGYTEGVEYAEWEALEATDAADHPYLDFWWEFSRASDRGTVTFLTKIAGASDWHAQWALLKSKHPDRFGERLQLTGADGGPIEVSAARQVLYDKLDRLMHQEAIDVPSTPAPAKPKARKKSTAKKAQPQRRKQA